MPPSLGTTDMVDSAETVEIIQQITHHTGAIPLESSTPPGREISGSRKKNQPRTERKQLAPRSGVLMFWPELKIAKNINVVC